MTLSTSNINQLAKDRPTGPIGQYPDKIRSLPLFDGNFDAYKMHSDDCDILFASYPANSSVEAHTHETENHGVVTRGELILTINAEANRYAIGDWYHVPAGQLHKADFEQDTDTIELWFKVKA